MVKRTKKRKKSRKNKTKKVYDKNDFSSGEGMLTSVWGPSLWHYLHTMSFNYPVKPTKQDKKIHKFILSDIKRIIDKNNFILGSYVFKFEKNFAKFCNSKYAISCANGTDALTLALKSLNISAQSPP